MWGRLGCHSGCHDFESAAMGRNRKWTEDAMSDGSFEHQLRFLICLDSNADHRAPGGAVTVALCGHWEHDGSCRWPHHTRLLPAGDTAHECIVDYDAPDSELAEVRCRVEEALERGQLVGPDGHLSTWRLVR